MKVIISVLAVIVLTASVSESITPQQIKKAEHLKNTVVELFNQGDFRQAIPLLKEVLLIDPSDTTASRYLSVAEQQIVEPLCKEAADAYRAGDYLDAIEQWEKILEDNPNDIRVEKMIEMTKNLIYDTTLNSMYALVNNFIKEGDYENAVNELEKIVTINPHDEDARALLVSVRQTLIDSKIKEHYEKAELYMKKENYVLAIAEWEKILDIDEDQKAASRLIADAMRKKMASQYADAQKLYMKGDYVESRDLYYQIMADNPRDNEVKEIIKRLNDTLNVVQKVQGEGLAWDIIRKALANHIGTNGNKQAAIAASWYAVQLEPDNNTALLIRDYLERKYISVLRVMEPPVRDMNIIDQYLFAALNHIYEGRYDLAIQECSIVIELQPQNVLALKRLGSAYYAMGKKEKARDVWKNALKLSPNDSELKQYINKTR